jgi:carbon-monoxide dehydrogenase large subunit
MEQAVYDRQTGQLLAGSMLDYALPHAIEVPEVTWLDNGLASATNIFGAKGCGEAGTSAAPPAVMNAIADALSDYPGVWDLQMPAGPTEIRRIIDAAG